MGLEEGTRFLLHRAGIIDAEASVDMASPANVAKAKEIVQVLDGLPLALDQAAAYIEETECGLAGYLTRYQTQRAVLLQHRGDLISDHPDPVAATWKLSFQKVEQANPAAASLLRLPGPGCHSRGDSLRRRICTRPFGHRSFAFE